MKFIHNLIFKFKKYHNIQSPEQAKIIASEIEAINTIAGDESSDEYKKEYGNQKFHNSTCPLCGGKTVVNKITRVQGHGEVSGSFSLGFGSVYGRTDIDTNDVNHCSSCGNQWKKYEIKYRGKSETLSSYVNDIATHIEGRYSFAKKTYDKLSHFKAETIFAVINGGDVWGSELYSKTTELDLPTLRKYFKSVFDIN